jgi:hypothetical protein
MKLNNKQLEKHLDFLQSFYFMMWKETQDDSWYDKKDSVVIIKDQLKKL